MKWPSWRLLHAAATLSLAIGTAYYWNLHRDESARRVAVEKQLREVSARQAARTRFPMLARMPRPAAPPADAPTVAQPPTASPPPAQASAARAMDLQRQTMRDRLADPAQRRAMVAMQRSGLINRYGDLLRRWQLPADKVDRVLDALAEELLRGWERMASADPGQRQLAMADMTVGLAPTDSIAGLDVLTTEQLAQLDRYRNTLNERMALGPLFDELDLARVPLTPSQQDQLVQLQHDERAIAPPPDWRSASQDPAEMRRIVMAYESALAQRIRDGAAGLLSSEQLARYDQYLQQPRNSGNRFFAPGTLTRAGGAVSFASGAAVTIAVPAPRP